MVEDIFDARSQFNPSRWAVLEKACDAGLPVGCIMEIGCQRCGNLAWLSQRFPDRTHYGYDRFEEGMTAPGKKDMKESASYHEGAMGVDYADCVQYLADIAAKYKCGPTGLIKGDIKDTFKAVGDLAPIALAIVDLNLYEPTMIALLGVDRIVFNGVWHHMSPGGVILVDDLGFPGVDAALADAKLPWKKDGFFGVIRKPR